MAFTTQIYSVHVTPPVLACSNILVKAFGFNMSTALDMNTLKRTVPRMNLISCRFLCSFYHGFTSEVKRSSTHVTDHVQTLRFILLTSIVDDFLFVASSINDRTRG